MHDDEQRGTVEADARIDQVAGQVVVDEGSIDERSTARAMASITSRSRSRGKTCSLDSKRPPV